MADKTPIDASLVLAGGLALGAYQVGVLEALDAAGIVRIHTIVGSSIGAINGAILAGGRPDEGIARLRRFWSEIGTGVPPAPWPDPFELGSGWMLRHPRNWINALSARTMGVPGVFHVRTPADPSLSDVPSFYANPELLNRLDAIIDLDALNDGPVRFCAATTDVETCESVLYDTAAQRVTVEHVAASGALLPSFQPLRLDGRVLADGGLSANAPFEALLAGTRRSPPPALCIMIDLFSPTAAAPRSLAAATERSTDMQFAAQTLLRLDAVQRERALEVRLAQAGATEALPPGAMDGTHLVHLSYRPLDHDAGPEKQYDFSRATLGDRQALGRRDGEAAAALISQLSFPPAPGLTVHHLPP